jgi:hypothetical protein
MAIETGLSHELGALIRTARMYLQVPTARGASRTQEESDRLLMDVRTAADELREVVTRLEIVAALANLADS